MHRCVPKTQRCVLLAGQKQIEPVLPVQKLRNTSQSRTVLQNIFFRHSPIGKQKKNARKMPKRKLRNDSHALTGYVLPLVVDFLRVEDTQPLLSTCHYVQESVGIHLARTRNLNGIMAMRMPLRLQREIRHVVLMRTWTVDSAARFANLRTLHFFLLEQPICKPTFPTTLTSLNMNTMRKTGWQMQDLPKQLTSLRFDLVGATCTEFPTALTKLKLSWSRSTGEHRLWPRLLPATLKSLDCGNFNQQLLPGMLPASLTVLKCGNAYTKSIQVGTLPEGLISLSCGLSYCSEFAIGVLPATLRILQTNSAYRCGFAKDVLPEELLQLETGCCSTECNVPSSLRCLQVNACLPRIPFCNLLHLRLSFFDDAIDPGVLPMTLLYLECGKEYTQGFAPGALPPNLLHLDCGPTYNAEFRLGILPPKLTTLICGDRFCIPFQANVLPPNLQVLHCGSSYDVRFEPGILPPGLKELYCNCKATPVCRNPALVVLKVSMWHSMYIPFRKLSSRWKFLDA
jgi:hypothetical protein